MLHSNQTRMTLPHTSRSFAIRASILALSLSLAAIPAQAAKQDWSPSDASASVAPSPDTVLAQAFDYAFPMVLMGRFRAVTLGAQGKPASHELNTWRHARKLSGPQDRAVTTPNTDTLYSSLWLDLSQGPVSLSVPDTAGRYYSLAFLDMATNNFAMEGRRSSGTRAGTFVVVGPNWTEPLPIGQRVVRAPANDVLVLSRILVNGPDDLPAVHALQDQYRVQPLTAGRHAAWTRMPPDGLTPKAFVDMANLMLERDPAPRFEEGLLRRFAAVGICGAACHWDALPELVQAQWIQRWPALLASVKGGLSGTSAAIDGWNYTQNNIGNFGTDYAYRAQIALGALLALEPAEAIYPSTGLDQQGQALNGQHRYRLVLPAGVPAVNAFWSLSMYQIEADGQLFFTTNTLERYAIGDRTRGLIKQPDGTVSLWIQREAPADAAQRANWLPAPPGDFRLVMRAYEPKDVLRDSRQQLPSVERID